MIPAVVCIDKSRVIGRVEPQIFGQYLEHVQLEDHCIYGAVMDAATPSDGLRDDVIAACRDLQVPVVRWPGGCFADVYDWQDGIGPHEQRPVRRNWHWGGLESNQFGTDEFLAWCERVGCAPYINVNLGTGTLDKALRWLDYCNGTQPSSDVRARHANGRQNPYQVPFWGIGNESWGLWEAGHMTAQEYAQRLRNWAQFFRRADPNIRILGVGSHDGADPTWDLTVLRNAGNLIDYLTTHTYAHTIAGDASAAEYYSTVGTAVLFAERLQRVKATIDSGMGSLRRNKPIRIALDEWNVRHMVQGEDGSISLERKSPRTLTDALFAAGVFHTMLRLSPHVGMACYVFLVNGNGVLLAGPDGIVTTPLYDLFKIYRRCMQGSVVETVTDTPGIAHHIRDGSDPNRKILRNLDYVDAIAVQGDDKRTLSVGIVNRHLTEKVSLKLQADGVERTIPTGAWELYSPDPLAANTFASPHHIVLKEAFYPDGAPQLELKPHSITVLQFRAP